MLQWVRSVVRGWLPVHPEQTDSSFHPECGLTCAVRCESLESRVLLSTVPSGFTESQLTGTVTLPTSMTFAPDGRLFVCLQDGAIRVFKNGTLLPTPFLNLSVNSQGERGLLGMTFDPSFSSNHFIYAYYTATSPVTHNRISQFTANGDVVVPGSEKVLLDIDPLSSATNHNGGALHFGTDGKLYAAVGENGNGANAQTLSNLKGKMLRLNSDGTIPSDNPFFNTASGQNRAIWALGLRNPFSFAIQPGSGRMFINDVGQSAFEEIDDGIAGANYGWPGIEGFRTTQTPPANYRDPLLAYDHSDGSSAITGGTFYNPAHSTFPSSYVGKYFFTDLSGGYIKVFNPSTKTANGFATGIAAAVDLDVGPDGALYCLSGAATSQGKVFRIQAKPPTPAPGTGLSAVYYNNKDFTGTTVRRTDATIDFDWGTGSPAAAIGPDTFSARWTGQVLAAHSETYTFYTSTDDGVKLWVNGKLIIDQFHDRGSVPEYNGSIALQAGKKYDIRVDYYENTGRAGAHLGWSSASTPKQIIPASALFKPATALTRSAIADATVRDGASANTNFGNASTLEVKTGPAGFNRLSYLKFDLSGISSIGTAKLRLFGRLDGAGSTNVRTGVFAVSNTAWTEAGLTYNNKPSIGASPLNSFIVTDNVDRFYEVDLTSYLRDRKAAGQNVVAIALKNLVTSTPITVFRSDEASSNRPELRITS